MKDEVVDDEWIISAIFSLVCWRRFCPFLFPGVLHLHNPLIRGIFNFFFKIIFFIFYLYGIFLNCKLIPQLFFYPLKNQKGKFVNLNNLNDLFLFLIIEYFTNK